MDNQQPSINSNFLYRYPERGKGFIYKYTSPSGKNYIGQTINSLNNRARNIYSGKGYKKCGVFWKAIQKYGMNNFTKEILEEVEINKLNKREQYYINLFNSLTPNGYNQCLGGEGGKHREVYVYSAQNGEFVEHYSSLSVASSELGIPIETISAILSDKSNRKQAHNLTFLSYYTPEYNIDNLARSNYHHIYVYDKDGNYYKDFIKITDAAKELGVTEGNIYKCLKGVISHAKRFQFKDIKTDKIAPIPKNTKSSISVCQIDPNTQEIIQIYPSLISAARGVGLANSGGIKKVIERGRGLSGGYFWKINEGSTTKSE